ncbi:PD-(D/E)XK nuclease superfamily protein [Variibacter gotjawalensis]|uniref:PD-(D/E)XK nuclease superfamily protein n=1 Tax=Variibacter gotjawalensis TaxID=1333996 RepID=A0A0S3Q189_9BRAD|nr:double-strand break repair protein AddB [Variibacter gotjawalensis]NIK47568.1 ATP-dependent helicase/nuclease subunit B [Variibacter gotjawalensis]RZS49465.1 DNA helicase/exodeoxyribonuclease V subunit B [Variibacter gotjawalensis]BAT61728.1 PD-(D/E)XK nuclease superfamily protein [Variibacter gotjawalensis]
MARRPRILSIPASAPFLPTLIEALASDKLFADFPTAGDPLSLNRATIYLPTRRACRLAREAFLRRGGTAVLPRLIAIGDVDEDELVFADAGRAEALTVPPAISPLERRLVLAGLVEKFANAKEIASGDAPLITGTPAHVLDLADALARLIDDMVTRDVDWKQLDKLVPDDFDPYWQLTLRFLGIAGEAWPAFLKEQGLVDLSTRRDALLAAEAERLRNRAPGPVIAAGSTASMPATARLLAEIARLPQGTVVLPGLDLSLDNESWSKIGGTPPGFSDPSVAHPQYGMFGFLNLVGVERDEVEELVAAPLAIRDKLVSEALRPAAATEHWATLDGGDALAAGFDDVAVIETETVEQEALAIAVALREAMEDPKRTAALVTPDRTLARRVKAALARWRVPVEDSGGEALSESGAGIFARLAATVALRGAEPVPLLALVKHSQFRLGRGEGGFAKAAVALERAVLRGPRPAAGSASLIQAVALLRADIDGGKVHRADQRTKLDKWQFDAADELATALHAALEPLESLAGQQSSLADFAARHRAVLDALSDHDDGEAELIDTALAELAESGAAQSFRMPAFEYPAFFERVLAGRVTRPPEDRTARVRIFGLLEARLQTVDRLVLGGLVEGVWPPQMQSDAWLSRPMRQQLGLDLPERRIGLTAHDFAQALGTRDVIMTRSMKVGGAPTVPSRFTQRLQAVLGEGPWKLALQRGEKYRAWARSLDMPETIARIAAPEPKPPLAARPTRFSVTEIEEFLRDPYSIYAKRVLGLAKLDPVDTPPGARDRGSAVHNAIEDFTDLYADGLPSDPYAELIKLGRKAFEPLAAHPDAQAFWWPRFLRVARWFAEWEPARRVDVDTVFAEKRGELEFLIGDRMFKLSARADRIEKRRDGSFALVDYKTGNAKGAKEVLSGLAPQLTLEAAIAQGGGFEDVPAGSSVTGLTYVQLKGQEPPGLVRELSEEETWKKTSPDAEAVRAFENLKQLLLRFEDEKQPYLSRSRPQFRQRYGDFDLLARVREWSATGGVVEEE